MDLYYSTRTAGGDWGPAKSLGNTINTKEDDDSPYLSQRRQNAVFLLAGAITRWADTTSSSRSTTASAASGAGPKTWATPSTRPTMTPTTASPRMARMPTSARTASVAHGEKDIYTISYIKNTIIVKGTVFSKRDSTQRYSGRGAGVQRHAELIKRRFSFRDVTKDPGGDYQVEVLSARTYQVAVNKDGKNIETQEFAVPISLNDSTSITKNFYVDYIDTTANANTSLRQDLFRYR
ncbi:MAG: hypothetical protein WKG07_47495 [Hymenobacter sp.]